MGFSKTPSPTHWYLHTLTLVSGQADSTLAGPLGDALPPANVIMVTAIAFGQGTAEVGAEVQSALASTQGGGSDGDEDNEEAGDDAEGQQLLGLSASARLDPAIMQQILIRFKVFATARRDAFVESMQQAIDAGQVGGGAGAPSGAQWAATVDEGSALENDLRSIASMIALLDLLELGPEQLATARRALADRLRPQALGHDDFMDIVSVFSDEMQIAAR